MDFGRTLLKVDRSDVWHFRGFRQNVLQQVAVDVSYIHIVDFGAQMKRRRHHVRYQLTVTALDDVSVSASDRLDPLVRGCAR